MDPSLDASQLVDLDEQKPVTALRVENHALLVPVLVRIASHVDVAEDLLPPLGRYEDAVAFEAGVSNP